MGKQPGLHLGPIRYELLSSIIKCNNDFICRNCLRCFEQMVFESSSQHLVDSCSVFDRCFYL